MIALGKYIMEFATVAVLKPNDLIKFNERVYRKESVIEFWLSDELVSRGLYDFEKYMLSTVPTKTGKVLVLGVGGGREAIALGKLGYSVTGVDFVEEMVAGARLNAQLHDVDLNVSVAEISNLYFHDLNDFDIVWISASLYSLIPSSKLRVKMLRQLRATLKVKGYLVCQYKFKKNFCTKHHDLASRFIAWCTFGNFNYETGDTITGGIEYQHYFSSKASLESEFTEAGFQTIEVKLSQIVDKGLITVKNF